jgi:alginate O-acetyltransferase complex protein AlgI
MTFTSPTFALFFAIIFALYWVLKRQASRNLLLLLASYTLYASFDPRFCILLLTSSSVDYAVGFGLSRSTSRPWRRFLLGLSLAVNLGALGFFKYYNFFIDSFRTAAAAVGWQANVPALRILLPVGISFFTFKTLSYTIDVYRGQTKATANFVGYLAYVSFFPQLLAGPIDRATNLLPQFLSARDFNYAAAVAGCRQILWGLFKKMVLADNLSRMVDSAYAAPSATPGPHLALATVCFAFQIYCDFAAYSDIAIGCASLLGFESTRNFNYPYFSQSVAEFWRRWHMSLTTWFRDYVFFSLPGVRGSRQRRALNLMITFLLSGLWHGAAWHFVVWGGLNGVAVLPEMFRGRSKPRGAAAATDDASLAHRFASSIKSVVRVAGTFATVCVLWIFFRAESLAQAVAIIRRIVLDSLNLDGYLSLWMVWAPVPRGAMILNFLLVFILVEWLQRHAKHRLLVGSWPAALRWAAYTGLLLVTVGYGFRATGQFVYFKF